MSHVLTWALDHLLNRQVGVRVRVHLANLADLNPDETPDPSATAASASFTTSSTTVSLSAPRPAYFVNVWNASPSRTVGITHVWIATDPETPVLAKRPPAQLEPDGQWETWVEAAKLPPGTTDVEHLARVKLTNGQVFTSVPREDVPSAGFVPG